MGCHQKHHSWCINDSIIQRLQHMGHLSTGHHIGIYTLFPKRHKIYIWCIQITKTSQNIQERESNRMESYSKGFCTSTQKCSEFQMCLTEAEFSQYRIHLCKCAHVPLCIFLYCFLWVEYVLTPGSISNLNELIHTKKKDQ